MCATGFPRQTLRIWLLFDDLLGIADPDVSLSAIDPDARRRRLTALVNAASLARESPVVYVVEDAHWIDEVSESMLAEFFSVIPQTPSLVLLTYRPEYRGALAQVHRCSNHSPCAPERSGDCSTGSPSCSARTPRLAHWVTRSPSGPPVIRSSPRKSCVNSPSVVWWKGSRAHTSRRQRVLR